MKYTYHRVCHTRSFKFDKFSSERREKKIINLHYAQFCEQRFLAVAKPCYVKGPQSCAPHKHFRWVQRRVRCCMCRSKGFRGLCSFYRSARIEIK